MDAPVTTQISQLRKMGLEDLRAKYQEVFGKPSQSRNRKQMFALIAKRLQVGAAEQAAAESVPKPTLVARFDKKRRAGSGKKTTPAGRGKKAGSKKGAKKEPTSRAKPIGERDPRIPAKTGCLIERRFKGKTHYVTVLADGFEYGGDHFKSLSAIAKKITGYAAINGFAFFKLGDKLKEKSKS